MKSFYAILSFIIITLAVTYCGCNNTKTDTVTTEKKRTSSALPVHSHQEKPETTAVTPPSESDSLLTALERFITPDSQISLKVFTDQSFNGAPMFYRIEETNRDDTSFCYVPSLPFIQALTDRISYTQFIKILQRIKKTAECDVDLRTDIRRKLKTIKGLKRHPVLLSFLKNDHLRHHSNNSDNHYALFTFDDLLRQSTTLSRKFNDHLSLHFWAECEHRGITNRMETFLDSIAPLFNPPVELPPLNVENCDNLQAVDHYFDSLSFIDQEVGLHSMLDCRDELIEHYIDEVVAVMYGDTVSIDNHSLQKVLSKYSRYFNPALHYFALQLDSLQQGNWTRFSVAPRLTLFPHKHNGKFSLTLKLTPVKQRVSPVVIYSALPLNSASVRDVSPSGYYPLKSTITHFRKLQPSDTNPAFLQTTYCFTLPSCEKYFREILITNRYRLLHQREKWNDTLRLSAYLSVITNDNDTVLIHKEKEYGTAILCNAYIGNPILTDVNGDGRYDIIIDVNKGGRLLFLQRENFIFEPRNLRNIAAVHDNECS